jgi:hypothetical protein
MFWRPWLQSILYVVSMYSSYRRLHRGILHALSHNGSWPLLYSLGTDHIENTASNNSSVVAYVTVAAVTWHEPSHCLATGVFAEPFPSNGCLWWLHNPGFQQTCHNIMSRNSGFRGLCHYTPLDVNLSDRLIGPIFSSQKMHCVSITKTKRLILLRGIIAVYTYSENCIKHINIMWRVYPLLGNSSVNPFTREQTRTTIGCLLLGNRSVNTPP